MKKVLRCVVCAIVTVCFLAGCTGTQISTEPTNNVEDDHVLKIMILGSSRSVNTFQLLYEVFKDQLPDQELVLGVMYHSGCSMSMHTDFIKNNQYVYDYYLNDSGFWQINKGVNMDRGLQDQNWDVVLLQAGNGDLANEMNKPCRIFLKNYVDKLVTEPYDLWWHSTWTNSTDPVLYAKPEDAAKVDQKAQLTNTNETAKRYVLDDPMFAGHITSGTPMMYALKELKVPETELYRDHTHLSDFGCLLVGYAWYAQFTGNPVREIGLDTIPKSLRHSQYQALGDLQITREMKQIIMDTVEYTMKNPWAIPG